MSVEIGRLVSLVSSVEDALDESGVTEEEMVAVYLLALAMRIHAESDREEAFKLADQDLRSLVNELTTLENQVAEDLGIEVDVLRKRAGL